MAVRKIGPSWWVDFVYDQVRYRKRSPDNSRAGAMAYEQTLRHRLREGEPIGGKETEAAKVVPTFAEFIPQWLSIYVDTNNRPSVRRVKRQVLNTHLLPFLGSLKLDEITPEVFERYKTCKVKENGKRTRRLLAPSTINQHLLVISRCLRTAQEWGMISTVPRVRLLRAPVRRVDFLTVEEKKRLLSDRGEPIWNLMVEVALRTGLRLGELLGLDWSNVNFEHRVIIVAQSFSGGVLGPPKNNRIRHVPLSPELFGSLRPLRRQSGLVFSRSGGRLVSSYPSHDALRRICRRVGVRPIGWHLLRHTFATHAVAAGVPLRVVQEMLGHASITMTVRYAHVVPWMMHEAMDKIRAFDEQVTALHGNGPSIGALQRPPETGFSPHVEHDSPLNVAVESHAQAARFSTGP